MRCCMSVHNAGSSGAFELPPSFTKNNVQFEFSYLEKANGSHVNWKDLSPGDKEAAKLAVKEFDKLKSDSSSTKVSTKGFTFTASKGEISPKNETVSPKSMTLTQLTQESKTLKQTVITLLTQKKELKNLTESPTKTAQLAIIDESLKGCKQLLSKYQGLQHQLEAVIVDDVYDPASSETKLKMLQDQIGQLLYNFDNPKAAATIRSIMEGR